MPRLAAEYAMPRLPWLQRLLPWSNLGHSLDATRQLHCNSFRAFCIWSKPMRPFIKFTLWACVKQLFFTVLACHSALWLLWAAAISDHVFVHNTACKSMVSSCNSWQTNRLRFAQSIR